MKRVRALRSDRSGVSPVIATILMVAITVVLAAVLFVMVSGLLPPLSETKPIVSLGFAELDAGNATVVVAGASPAYSPSSYRVNVQVGGTPGTAIAMPTTSGGNVPVCVGGTGAGCTGGTIYRVFWTDIGGGGTINTGDQFRVTGDGVALPDASDFILYLIWSDGSTVAERGWSTS